RGAQGTEPARIMVVDDIPANLKILTEIVAGYGYRVRPASSGYLALRSVEAETPDLILLDVKMPEMDGYEVCRRLKADEKSRSIPVIFISALDETEDKVKGFEAGGVDYITKPFQPSEALKRIETHLSLRRLQLRLEAQNIQLQQEIDERRKTEEELKTHKARLEELVAERTANIQQEIRERRRAEETLRENAHFLQTLMDAIPTPIFYKDIRGVYQGCNTAFEVCLGMDKSRIIGKSVYDVASKEWADRYREMDKALFRQGGVQSYESSFRYADGLLHDVLFNKATYTNADGSLGGLVGVILDISDHKRAEITIREANERFRTVLRAATAYSIIGTDMDGIIKVFNEGAELMLGYRAEEIIDKAGLEMIHDPDEVADRAAEMGINPGFEVLVSAARHGETETREWTYIRKDGSRLTVSLTVTAMQNDTGILTGFIGIARDITIEKKLEQQLIQSQKMECVGLLAGGVAHDFNNLLTPILGYTEMLMAGFSGDDPRYKRLQKVKQSADRAKELTGRLLAFSRKQLIELKTVRLGDIIYQFENVLRRTIRENICIDVMISSSLSEVQADAGQIELLLLNLSINAQDAMPEGGVLKIEIMDIDLDESYTAKHPEITPGPYVMLAVSDTGVGMDEKIMEHIFEPFFTTKEPGKGTGLGLSTVYGIVKQHGGSICVYSEINRGSVFKVFLPRMVEGETTIEAHPSLPDVVAHGIETILVAEDNEVVRTLACEMLESLGYHVLATDTPDRCVDLVKEYQGSIDLLLTDVVMPGMNGKELLDLLKRIRPDLRVLFMSGYASNVIGHHGVLDEGVAFIQKPFTMLLLAGKVRHVLDN
ncbi:MAG: response regulator, partial [Deltaproteobacteria bacterium]|nr:response regulator [Deltaproteobacteria bacterium]